jgi:hypothetical protein
MFVMRHSICICYLLVGLLVAPCVWGQTTITDRPWEVTSGKALWTALLPAYELGTNANGASAFRDNLDDVGYLGDLKLTRHFFPTRTSVGARGFWALADSINTTEVIDIDVPSPGSGASNLFSGSGTHLKSKLRFYGVDTFLADTWRTRYGGLTAGLAFSYMALDQTFDADYGTTQLLREKLNTDFLGGKALLGWDGCFCNRLTKVDLAIGIYDMDTDYRLIEQTITGSLDQDLGKTVTTIEPTVTTYRNIHGYRFGFTLGAMYFSDLPRIIHNFGSPTTLGTDDAVMLTGMLEILL